MGPGVQSKHKHAVASMSLFFYEFNGRISHWNRHTLNSGSVTAIGMPQIAKNSAKTTGPEADTPEQETPE